MEVSLPVKNDEIESLRIKYITLKTVPYVVNCFDARCYVSIWALRNLFTT